MSGFKDRVMLVTIARERHIKQVVNEMTSQEVVDRLRVRKCDTDTKQRENLTKLMTNEAVVLDITNMMLWPIVKLMKFAKLVGLKTCKPKNDVEKKILALHLAGKVSHDSLTLHKNGSININPQNITKTDVT